MELIHVILGSCIVSAFTALFAHQYMNTAEMLMINNYTSGPIIYMRYDDDLKRMYNLTNENIKEIYDDGFICINVNGRMIEISKLDTMPVCEVK